MANHSPATVIAAFTAAAPSRPLVTYYDDSTGERTELSAETLANWVAKTANLLVDSVGVVPGDVAAVRLPAHWQSVAVLLGCWAVGARVDLGYPVDLGGLVEVGTSDEAQDTQPPVVAFVTAERVGEVSCPETYALALAPMGGGFANPPAGTLDYTSDVRGHADHFAASTRVGGHTLALADGTTHADLVLAAEGRGLATAARYLIDGDRHPDPIDWLVAPLVAGGSVVLCRNLDRDAVAARLHDEQALPYPDEAAP